MHGMHNWNVHGVDWRFCMYDLLSGDIRRCYVLYQLHDLPHWKILS